MLAALLGGGEWRTSIPSARAAAADVICLPHLSFTPYFPAVRDRSGLELAERAPARSLREAVELADGAWLAASAYESEGEGVFYATAALARAGGPLLRHRQRAVEARPGRYEQMFFAPGHDERAATLDLPWGPTGTLIGAELRDADAWGALARAGARVVIGGASEPEPLWATTRRIATGMSAAHALVVLVANRHGEEHGIRFAGEGLALAADGSSLAIEDGLVEIP